MLEGREKKQKHFKFDSITFDVWGPLKDGRYAFDYKKGSRRVLVRRKSLAALKERAGEIAIDLLNGETDAIQLDAPTRRVCVAALDAIRPTGLMLDVLAREAAAAFELTGGASIGEMAKFYAGRNPNSTRQGGAGAILAALLAALGDEQRSAKYIGDLRRDLAPFCAVHPDISAVKQEDIRSWLRDRKKTISKKTAAGTETGNLPVSSRRRDNIRNALVRLFSHARDGQYLPCDRKTEAEKIPRIDGGSEVTTYTSRELQILLDAVSKKWRPWMVIAAFAGMRTSEIFRLDWSAFKWERGVIAVQRKIARKVRISRLVPMQPNLVNWLDDWHAAHGPLYPHTNWRSLESEHQREIQNLEKHTGITWENNALRHSFGSCRLAILKDFAHVALEMGNSAAKVREHYNDPKDEVEAIAYFNIQPPHLLGDNILRLPLKFR